MPVERKAIQLRLPADLAEKIAETAAGEGRSVNNWIEQVIYRYLVTPRRPEVDTTVVPSHDMGAKIEVIPSVGFGSRADLADTIGDAVREEFKVRAKVRPAKTEAEPRFKGKAK